MRWRSAAFSYKSMSRFQLNNFGTVQIVYLLQSVLKFLCLTSRCPKKCMQTEGREMFVENSTRIFRIYQCWLCNFNVSVLKILNN